MSRTANQQYALYLRHLKSWWQNFTTVWGAIGHHMWWEDAQKQWAELTEEDRQEIMGHLCPDLTGSVEGAERLDEP